MKLLLHLSLLGAVFVLGAMLQANSAPATQPDRLVINDPLTGDHSDRYLGFIQQLMVRFQIKSIVLKTKLHPEDWKAGSLIFTSEDPDRRLFESEQTTLYLEDNK